MNRLLLSVATLGCLAMAASGCGRLPSSLAGPPDMPAACAATFQLPAEALTIPEPLPPVVNRSKVAPQVATAWARGLLRALRVEAWALANSRDDVLTSGCLGDQRAQAQLFGDETYLIRMARRDHAGIVVTPAEVSALTLVEVGSAQRSVIGGDQQVASTYAWLVTTRGPAGVLLVASSGDATVVIAMPDGEHERDFYGGFYVAHSWAGPLWFQQSYYSCLSIKGRALCA